MSSNILIGLIFGIGFGGWIYSKMYRRTGGNTSNSIIVAGLCGAAGWLFFTFVMMYISSLLE